MTVYILSALLLGVLAYAVFQLTKKSEVDKEIEKLTQEDESYLLAELYSVNFTVWLCFVGGLPLTMPSITFQVQKYDTSQIGACISGVVH